MSKKVYVIDDDEGLLAAFEAMLDSAGYSVVTCSDADCLNELTSNNLPNLILLDVLLSGIDGRDICKKLKSQNLTKNIPVIMVSAHPSASKSIQKVGANDFLAKPFEMNELLEKVAQYIK